MTYGLMALEREMSTPPISSRSMAHFTLPGGKNSMKMFDAGKTRMIGLPYGEKTMTIC